jgi:hypothetical protein
MTSTHHFVTIFVVADSRSSQNIAMYFDSPLRSFAFCCILIGSFDVSQVSANQRRHSMEYTDSEIDRNDIVKYKAERLMSDRCRIFRKNVSPS